MYYIIHNISYNQAPEELLITVRRKWGTRAQRERGWLNLSKTGLDARLLNQVLKSGDTINLSAEMRIKYTKPRNSEKGGSNNEES